MSTDTLCIEVQPKPPRTFIRGQSLEFLMDLPPNVPANFFDATTTLAAELRRVENAGTEGLIAPLIVTWEAGTDFTQLRFRADNTEAWALGPVEFDVVFTKGTKKFRSLPVRFTILDGVTA